MNRFILTLAFTITALVMSTGEASAFFRKKKACAQPVQAISYQSASHSDACCGSGNSHYGSSSYGQQYYGNSNYSQPYYGNSSYGQQYYGNSNYGQPYYNNMGYGSSNSNGVLGNVSNFGGNVIDTTGRVLTAPFRAVR